MTNCSHFSKITFWESVLQGYRGLPMFSIGTKCWDRLWVYMKAPVLVTYIRGSYSISAANHACGSV